MCIYDVRFYGVYFHSESGLSGINLHTTKKEVHKVPRFENLLFEIALLREYEGKKDVLKIEFEDGTSRYETLNAPYRILKNGVWETSCDTSIPEEFGKQYYFLQM